MVEGNPIPEGFMLAPLSRATVFVRDQAESLKLYRDILGLRIRLALVAEDARFNQVLGLQGARVKVAILQSGEAVYGNVGLFEILGGEDRVPPPVQAPYARTGEVGLVFPTNALDVLAEKVMAAGYTIIAPSMVLFPRLGAAEQDREMLFRDRDGVQVCLMQKGR
jgi:catechol 2,3-dioxygenase-like lactoylglutathione lyase family enzyme